MFPLYNSLPTILQVFECEDEALCTTVQELVIKFDPDTPFWKVTLGSTWLFLCGAWAVNNDNLVGRLMLLKILQTITTWFLFIHR